MMFLACIYQSKPFQIRAFSDQLGTVWSVLGLYLAVIN